METMQLAGTTQNTLNNDMFKAKKGGLTGTMDSWNNDSSLNKGIKQLENVPIIGAFVKAGDMVNKLTANVYGSLSGDNARQEQEQARLNEAKTMMQNNMNSEQQNVTSVQEHNNPQPEQQNPMNLIQNNTQLQNRNKFRLYGMQNNQDIAG